jgi:hypothetical protein
MDMDSPLHQDYSPESNGPNNDPVEVARSRKRIAQQTYRARQKQYVLSLEEKLERLHSDTYEEVNGLLNGNVGLAETLKELRLENKLLRDRIEEKIRDHQKARGGADHRMPVTDMLSRAALPMSRAESQLPVSGLGSLLIATQVKAEESLSYPPSSHSYTPLPHAHTFHSNTTSARQDHFSTTSPSVSSMPSPFKLPPPPVDSASSPRDIHNNNQGLPALQPGFRLPSFKELDLGITTKQTPTASRERMVATGGSTVPNYRQY